jgi:hypothetical protein
MDDLANYVVNANNGKESNVQWDSRWWPGSAGPGRKDLTLLGLRAKQELRGRKSREGIVQQTFYRVTLALVVRQPPEPKPAWLENTVEP